MPACGSPTTPHAVPIAYVEPGQAVNRVLIANRGEVAARILRACRAAGLEAVAVYSTADRGAPFLSQADRAVCIGPPPAAQSYLMADALLAAALGTGCDAVHPGYGFMAENAGFARRCAEHGLTFVGPSPESIDLMGDKIAGRAAAVANGVPVVPGSDADVADLGAARRQAGEIGYPLLLKASAGGGGRGMRVVRSPAELEQRLVQAGAEAAAAFSDSRVYMERYFPKVHHVEVQVFGDRHGNHVHLGERDCSAQRRHQKLVEESPSPVIGPALRETICEASIRLARGVGYENAGTVEFIVDPAEARCYFIEMNTRIQVEHPVTEMVTDADLVLEQLRVAAGEPLSFTSQSIMHRGHAIEWRINAEDPERGFLPAPGRLTRWSPPPQGPRLRVDTFVRAGQTVTPYYDSMLAKLIVHGDSRAEALERSAAALDAFVVEGVSTTIGFQRAMIDHRDFIDGRVHTRWIEERGQGAGA